MTLLRCECCQGRKHVIGLGGMQKKCGNCMGVGFVKVVDVAVVDDKPKSKKGEV